jgi:hypothetical protein
MAELVADSDQPAPPPSNDDERWDPSAAGYRPARRVSRRSWQKSIKKSVLPHLERSLPQVRRSLSIHGWLIQFSVAVRLLASSSLMLLSWQTAFFASPGGSIQILLPKAVAFIALGFLTLPRVSVALAAQGQKLKSQELMYLSCANAIAQNDGEAFERAMKGLFKPLRS